MDEEIPPFMVARAFSNGVLLAIFSIFFFLLLALFPFVWGEKQIGGCISFEVFSSGKKLTTTAFDAFATPGGYALVFIYLGSLALFLLKRALFDHDRLSLKIKHAYCLYLVWFVQVLAFFTVFFWLLSAACFLFTPRFSFTTRLFLMKIIPAVIIFIIGASNVALMQGSYALFIKYPALQITAWWANDMTVAIVTARLAALFLLFCAGIRPFFSNDEQGMFMSKMFVFCLIFHLLLLLVLEYLGDAWIASTIKQPIPFGWKISYQAATLFVMLVDLYYLSLLDELPQEDIEFAMLVLNPLLGVFCLVHMLKVDVPEKSRTD